MAEMCVIVTVDKDGRSFCSLPSHDGSHRVNLNPDILEKGCQIASVHVLPPNSNNSTAALQSATMLLLKK